MQFKSVCIESILSLIAIFWKTRPDLMAGQFEAFGRRLNLSFQRQDGSHVDQLNDFLSASKDVYSDVLTLLSHISMNYSKQSGVKTSLPYIVIQQLDQFVTSRDNSSQLMARLLTQTVRTNALHLAIKKKNKTWIDIIVDVFHLKTIRREQILEIVHKMLSENKFFDASLIVIKFELTDDFDVQQILVPLLFQDKLTVVDDYIRGNEKTHGFQFIRFLDKCFVDRNYGLSVASHIPEARIDKMNPKMLEKLVVRLLKQHNIDENACPHIIGRRSEKQLKYLLFKKYIEGGLSDGSWREMLTSAVGNSKPLQEEVIHMIVSYGDLNEAFKWADSFGIPVKRRPYCIQTMTKVSQTEHNNSSDDWAEDTLKDGYYGLKLSILDDIVWVNKETKFRTFIDQTIEGSQIIGIDGEWPPIFGTGSVVTPKLSTLQISSEDSCHIIDVLNLRHSSLWTHFVDNILNSKSILKLGFGIHNDLSLIKTSINIETNVKPQNVLDLSTIFDYVLSEYSNLIDVSVIAEARRRDVKGLSKVVFILFGKPLDKSETFSDWDRRPLREEQFKYAALDSFCLIEIFNKLKQLFVENDYDFNEFIDNYMKGKPKRVNKMPKLDSSDREPGIQFPMKVVKEFRAVCDTMLQGLGRYLRICGADVEILDSHDNHHKAARIALDQRRVLLTCGAPYEMFKSRLSDGMCYRVNNNCSAYEQMEAVLQRYNIRVTLEDLFTRCPKCNCNAFEIQSNDLMKKLYKTKPSTTSSGTVIKFDGFHISVFERVDEFLICNSCGQVYWDGCHQNRWKDKIKTILFPNTTVVNEDIESHSIICLN